MKSLKSIAVIIGVGLFLIVLSMGFVGKSIQERAIVLGVGLDFDGDDCVITAEVVSPGGGSQQQVGTFSKLVCGKGATVGEAIEQISLKTGKEASLGLCTLLVLGESALSRNVFEQMDFFAFSDSFRESAMVCCCNGSAEQLLQRGVPLMSSVSMGLATTLKDSASELAVPTSNLLDFARSQMELDKCGFMNKVDFAEDDNPVNKDAASPQKTEGYFQCKTIAVFREYSCLGVLEEEEAKGFALLNDKVKGNIFVAENNEVTPRLPSRLTLRADRKSADISVDLDKKTVDVKLKLQVKQLKTDSSGSAGALSAKTDEELNKFVLDDVSRTAKRQAEAFLERQRRDNFDLVQLHRALQIKYGTASADVNISDFAFNVEAETSEE